MSNKRSQLNNCIPSSPDGGIMHFVFEFNGAKFEIDDIPLDTEQVAKLLNKSCNAILMMAKKRQIPYYKKGRKNYYSIKAIRAEIMQNPISVVAAEAVSIEDTTPPPRKRRSKKDWVIK